jgi:hypothetical protein
MKKYLIMLQAGRWRVRFPITSFHFLNLLNLSGPARKAGNISAICKTII